MGEDVAITGVTTDSRNVAPGDLFVALKGPSFDGHDYVPSAIRAGAVAALVEAGRLAGPASHTTIEVDDPLSALGRLGRWWRLEAGIPVLGLTGSNGKTSTKELAAALLATGAATLRTEGNLNNRIGVPMTLLGIEARHAVAVVEMGMNQRGEIADLTRMCVPDVALLLNVGPAHIGELGSIRAIAEAKAEMLHNAPATSTLVVNADDDRVMEHALQFERDRLRTFGTSASADVRLLDRAPEGAGQRLSVGIDGATRSLRLGLPGRHAAMNALAALAAVTALPDSVRPALDAADEAWGGLSPVAGRFMVRRVGEVNVIDDAYNANPGSLNAALDTLLEIRGGAPFGVVLGEMNELGEHSEAAHRDAGARFAEVGAAFVATLGPGARPATEAAVAAGVDGAHLDEDVDVLAAFVRDRLAPNMWVLVKGSRGVRLERLIAQLENA